MAKGPDRQMAKLVIKANVNCIIGELTQEISKVFLKEK